MTSAITIFKNSGSQCARIMWLAALIATSCIFPQHYDIPAENRPSFSSGDRFVFKDGNTGRTDTLEVSVVVEKYQHNKDDYYERIRVNYTMLQNGLPGSSFVSVVQEIDLFMIQSQTIILRPDTLYEDYVLPDGNVIHAVRRFVTLTPAVPGVVEIYYHQRQGMVKYVYNDGQAPELVGPVR